MEDYKDVTQESLGWAYTQCVLHLPLLTTLCSLYFVCAGQVRIPKQLVVVGDAACIPTSVAEAGLKLPLGVLYLLPHG